MLKPSFRFILMTTALLCSGSLFASDAEDVKAVIQSAYVEGIHIESNVEKIRAGFHPSFTMFIKRDESVSELLIEDWIKRIEAGAEKRKKAPKPKVKAEFPVVSVSGNAAIARVELYRNGKLTFTDFLSLYKFGDGWQIVAKSYYRH